MCMHVYMFMSTACALCEWTMQMDQRIRVRAVLAAGGGVTDFFAHIGLMPDTNT